jgi:DNA invertase Pin-like site-specific DNA recombinase
LDQLLKDAHRGDFKIIIVAALDRIGRSTKHILNLLDELKHYGISIISLRENLDFSTPAGQMALTVLLAVATLERQILSERVKSALAAKKVLAEKMGSPWRCGRPNVVTEAIAQEVLRLRAEGLSIRGIEKAINKQISKTSIERVLKAKK